MEAIEETEETEEKKPGFMFFGFMGLCIFVIGWICGFIVGSKPTAAVAAPPALTGARPLRTLPHLSVTDPNQLNDAPQNPDVGAKGPPPPVENDLDHPPAMAASPTQANPAPLARKITGPAAMSN